MFTGLVETLGTIQHVRDDGPGRRLTLSAPALLDDMKLGDSVAVNGCCLTVVELTAAGFSFEAGPETLRLTNLGELQIGDRVNLERSLRFGDRLGGHLVTGHVDCMGTIRSRERRGEFELIWFTCLPEWTRQIVAKGSITVDGISLKVVGVGRDGIVLMLI